MIEKQMFIAVTSASLLANTLLYAVLKVEPLKIKSMSEYVRETKIEVEIDTNKSNTKVAFDNYFEAVEWLWEKLSDEQRLSFPRCHGCGSLNTSCQCWNDD